MVEDKPESKKKLGKRVEPAHALLPLPPPRPPPLPPRTSNTMSGSRTELIGWLNDLLQINYTKVEQCGTGGAYCQIVDSVFGASLYAIARASPAHCSSPRA